MYIYCSLYGKNVGVKVRYNDPTLLLHCEKELKQRAILPNTDGLCTCCTSDEISQSVSHFFLHTILNLCHNLHAMVTNAWYASISDDSVAVACFIDARTRFYTLPFS